MPHDELPDGAKKRPVVRFAPNDTAQDISQNTSRQDFDERFARIALWGILVLMLLSLILYALYIRHMPSSPETEKRRQEARETLYYHPEW